MNYCATHDGLQHESFIYYHSNDLHMQEDRIISMLSGHDVDQRLEAIEMLEVAVKTANFKSSGIRLPFADCQQIFVALSTTLEDTEHDTRMPCLRMMLSLVPCLASDAGTWTATVLPSVIRCFDDARSAVHLCVVQILSSSLRNLNFQTTMQAIINQGVENDDIDVRKLVISYLPMLFTDELQNRNFVDLIYALFSSLSQKYLQSEIVRTIQELCNLVGKEKFTDYVNAMPLRLRDMYFLLLEKEKSNENANDRAFRELEAKRRYNDKHLKSFSSKYAFTESFSNFNMSDTPQSQTRSPNSLQFGIVLDQNLNSIIEDSDPQSRAEAVGDLRMTVADCSNVDRLVPNLQEFIEFLIMLLDDSNTKVNRLTLEIFALLVDKLSFLSIKPDLRHLILGLTKHLGDNIPFIREGIMKIVTKIMQIYSPESSLSVVCENLSHRNSRIRHESINVIIVALLTFPSSDFDLDFLCKKVAYALFDPKRQVRQAALECLAVLGQALGPHQHSILINAVRNVEKNSNGLGAIAAVQARLANLQLPKSDSCGLVEYVTCAYANAGNGNTADVDWILAASSGHGSSARSTISDSVFLESIETSDKSGPSSSSSSSSARLEKSQLQSLMARSRPGFRKSPAKMPWDSETSPEVQTKQVMRRNASSGDITRLKAFHSNQQSPNDVHLERGDWQGGVCPLPTYPRLVRSGSIKRISSCSAIRPIWNRIDQPESPYAAMSKSCWFPRTESGTDESSKMEFGSMRRTGNSASKRRVDKIFEKLKKREGQKSSSLQPINVVKLDANEMLEERESGFITRNQHLKSKEFPEAKTTTNLRSSSLHSKNKQSSELAEYNPPRGITIHSNPTSDVAVIGKTCADLTDLQPIQLSYKTCDQHRLSKGMFEKSSSAQSPSVAHDSGGDHRPMDPSLKSDSPGPLDGVYGVSVHGVIPISCKEEEPLEKRIGTKARPVKGKPSSTQRESSIRREVEMNSDGVIQVEDIRKEKQRRLDRLANQLKYDNLPEEDVCIAQKPPPPPLMIPDSKNHLKNRVKKSSSAATNTKRHSSSCIISSAAAAAVEDDDDPAHLLPSSNPLKLLSAAVKQLAQDDDWEVKCKGLNNIRRLAMHHRKVFSGQVASLSAAVTVEVKNLRSSVSVLAMKCLADMYAYLKSEMDVVLDQTTVALLLRFGDANKFIREEAERSLRVMTENLVPQKVLCCLISGGSQQRNSSIRALTAQLILSIVESLGPGYVLSGIKDITDKILPAAAAFLNDVSPEARFCARKIFHVLMAHEEFDMILPKYFSHDALKNIQKKLDHLKAKA